MSLKATAAVTEQSQSMQQEEVSEISQTVHTPAPAPLTISTAPTWFAANGVVPSERPPESLLPPRVSPDHAAKMKRIVLATVGVCTIIVLVAGWRLWQHRRAKTTEQTTAMITASPAPKSALPEPSQEASPNLSTNVATAVPPSSSNPSPAPPPSKTRRHAPAKTRGPTVRGKAAPHRS